MKPAWMLVVFAAPVVIAGLACSIVYHNASMFYVSLVLVVSMVVVLPVAVAFVWLLSRSPRLLRSGMGRLWTCVRQIFSAMKRARPPEGCDVRTGGRMVTVFYAGLQSDH